MICRLFVIDRSQRIRVLISTEALTGERGAAVNPFTDDIRDDGHGIESLHADDIRGKPIAEWSIAGKGRSKGKRRHQPYNPGINAGCS